MTASNRQEQVRDAQEVDQLVEACRDGDPFAGQRLYELCVEGVYRLAVRMVGVQDAADVTQQAFLQALSHIGQFNGCATFRTWLYRLTVNESLQHLRRCRRRRWSRLEWEPMDRSRPNEDAEQKDLLEQALERVDPQLRSIFLLREVEGLSYRDIAQSLGIPEGTVGSRLNRARHELQRHLKDLGWEP